jgi:oligopeptide transport system substrate-binding protein
MPYLQAVPKHVVEQWGDKWTDPSHMVTNGPYKLTSWQHDKQIVLDANPY